SRRRHTRFSRDWSSDVCSSDLLAVTAPRSQLHSPTNTYNASMGKLSHPLSQKYCRSDHACDVAHTFIPASRHIENGTVTMNFQRSEERRVGKESRSRRSRT